jgi:hypothetical protein
MLVHVFDTMVGMTDTAVSGDLSETVAALTADLDWLTDRELAKRLQELERIARRVEHAIVTTVARADRVGAWVEDGHRSVRGWCQATVSWSGADTTHRLRTAELLGDCGAVELALRHGAVGVAQVRELARARANPRCGDAMVVVEELLLADGQHLPFDEFRDQVRGWIELADADGSHRDHELAHDNRRASLEPVEDGYLLRGEGGAAQGATMKEIFDAFCDTEFKADCDEARRRLGIEPDTSLSPADLSRTAAQRRWDALVAIFVAAATNPDAGTSAEPVVDIVVDQTTFEAALTGMAAGRSLDNVMPPTPDPHVARCSTIHGVPLDPLDAVAAALIGRVRRVVYGSKSCTIDLGTTSRLFRGAARLAVWLQDGTRCRWPGCGHHHTEIDHADPWSRHGPTRPENGCPLCARHNRWKTRGYRTWRDPNGHWHTYRPDDTEITTS